MAKKAIVKLDGKVCLVSKTAAPEPLSEQDVAKINQVFSDNKKKLEDILNTALAAAVPMGCGHNLNLTIPDISME